MTENCLILLKPSFTKKELIKYVREEIEKLDFVIVKEGYAKYDKKTAKIHYIDKASCPYYMELVNYLSSEKVYGYIVKGENAIDTCRNKVEILRKEMIPLFKLHTTIMKNILHCTSKKEINEHRVDFDSRREIELFKSNIIN